jgi:hypothetical protein
MHLAASRLLRSLAFCRPMHASFPSARGETTQVEKELITSKNREPIGILGSQCSGWTIAERSAVYSLLKRENSIFTIFFLFPGPSLMSCNVRAKTAGPSEQAVFRNALRSVPGGDRGAEEFVEKREFSVEIGVTFLEELALMPCAHAAT